LVFFGIGFYGVLLAFIGFLPGPFPFTVITLPCACSGYPNNPPIKPAEGHDAPGRDMRYAFFSHRHSSPFIIIHHHCAPPSPLPPSHGLMFG